MARLLERSRLEANYRDLVEQANDLIFTQDLRGKLTSMNAAGLKFLGRSSGRDSRRALLYDIWFSGYKFQ